MTEKIDKPELATLSDVLASIASYILNSLLTGQGPERLWNVQKLKVHVQSV